ncbi:hypothetical protein HDU81_010398, partial [Chytriomyces hyalinus]
SAPPVEPASWTGPEANVLLHHWYDTFAYCFQNAKNKDEVVKGWNKIRLTLQLEMEVEYTVEQCKAKVQALRSLFFKLKAEEGQTGNLEKKTKKPDCFASMVLYFGSKSGLNGETLGDAEDGATMSQEDALDKFQNFMAVSKNAVAGSSSSTVSSSGSLADIDFDTDSLDDTVDGNKTAASKQSDLKLEKLEPKPKCVKPDVAGALETLGGRVGDGISNLAKAIAVSHKADPQFKNLESLLTILSDHTFRLIICTDLVIAVFTFPIVLSL